jgi:hypothetical protein
MRTRNNNSTEGEILLYQIGTFFKIMHEDAKKAPWTSSCS